MALVMKVDKLLDDRTVGLLGPITQMPKAHHRPNLSHELSSCHYCLLAAIAAYVSGGIAHWQCYAPPVARSMVWFSSDWLAVKPPLWFSNGLVASEALQKAARAT